MNAISWISRQLSRLALLAAGIGLSLMTLILLWQVFARYVLQAAPAWTEQSALVLMMGFICLAASVGIREGFHIGITMAVDALSPVRQRLVRAVSMLIVAAVGVCMGVYGAQLVQATWDHVVPGIGIARGAVYLPIPIAGWLVVFFACEQILAELRAEKVEPLWN